MREIDDSTHQPSLVTVLRYISLTKGGGDLRDQLSEQKCKVLARSSSGDALAGGIVRLATLGRRASVATILNYRSWNKQSFDLNTDLQLQLAIMSYFFSTPVDIDIVLEDTDDRSMIDMKLDKGRREKAPLYMDGESVKGGVTIRPKDGKRLEHTGIKVQFIGTIGTPS